MLAICAWACFPISVTPLQIWAFIAKTLTAACSLVLRFFSKRRKSWKGLRNSARRIGQFTGAPSKSLHAGLASMPSATTWRPTLQHECPVCPCLAKAALRMSLVCCRPTRKRKVGCKHSKMFATHPFNILLPRPNSLFGRLVCNFFSSASCVCRSSPRDVTTIVRKILWIGSEPWDLDVFTVSRWRTAKSIWTGNVCATIGCAAAAQRWLKHVDFFPALSLCFFNHKPLRMLSSFDAQ